MGQGALQEMKILKDRPVKALNQLMVAKALKIEGLEISAIMIQMEEKDQNLEMEDAKDLLDQVEDLEILVMRTMLIQEKVQEMPIAKAQLIRKVKNLQGVVKDLLILMELILMILVAKDHGIKIEKDQLIPNQDMVIPMITILLEERDLIWMAMIQMIEKDLNLILTIEKAHNLIQMVMVIEKDLDLIPMIQIVGKGPCLIQMILMAKDSQHMVQVIQMILIVERAQDLIQMTLITGKDLHMIQMIQME